MIGAIGLPDIVALLPELVLVLAGLCFTLAGAVGGDRISKGLWALSVGMLAVCAGLLWTGSGQNAHILGGAFVTDPLTVFAKMLVAIGLAASLTVSFGWWAREKNLRMEYPILILFAGAGMMLMISASTSLALYIAIEFQSLALYVLASFQRDSLRSGEAGLKYFVLGALSSGLLLFGISLVYGFSGQISFDSIAAFVDSQERFPPGLGIGLVFILTALAFKISAVPFHMWTPDVYEGAPSPVTALFAIVPKIAAVTLLVRLLTGPFAAGEQVWMPILFFLSIASMALGAFAAIGQQNIKRLMAYSAIGNMGYALIGLVVGGPESLSGTLVYLTIYMVMTAGAFAIILGMRRADRPVEAIADLAGLSRTAPVRAWGMAALMFSMAGIPPMAGFFGKLLVFNAAVGQGYYGLAVFGILTSVVAAWYYLRIIKVMFFDPSPETALDRVEDVPAGIVLTLSVLFVIGFAAMPAPLMAIARSVAEDVFASG